MSGVKSKLVYERVCPHKHKIFYFCDAFFACADEKQKLAAAPSGDVELATPSPPRRHDVDLTNESDASSPSPSSSPTSTSSTRRGKPSKSPRTSTAKKIVKTPVKPKQEPNSNSKSSRSTSSRKRKRDDAAAAISSKKITSFFSPSSSSSASTNKSSEEQRSGDNTKTSKKRPAVAIDLAEDEDGVIAEGEGEEGVKKEEGDEVVKSEPSSSSTKLRRVGNAKECVEVHSHLF